VSHEPSFYAWNRLGKEHLFAARGVVLLIVDTTKVGGYAIGTIAGYLAMVTLSVAQSPDHCEALPSILDLMSPSCGMREKPTAMTAGDLAFLKALYTSVDCSL
jgi:hypothetical protein